MMGRCPTCIHYQYRAGMSKELHVIAGTSGPTLPTCHCLFAGRSWVRQKAEVRKPRGIACDYKPKEFTCTDCQKHVSGQRIFMVFSPTTCLCNVCSKKEKQS